jgi:H+/Cl- antiporter ClcA
VVKYLFFWIAVGTGIAFFSGTASALFLVALDGVTQLQASHRWLLVLLPFAGFLIGYAYYRYGESAEKGNDLILEGLEQGQLAFPLWMAPLVFVGTLLTHLFGGSAGREGTAVQMGAAFAAQLNKRWALDTETTRLMVICGVAGGFASVFGTPLAGAIFSLEWMRSYKLDLKSLFPAFWTAFLAYWVCEWGWGIGHSAYVIDPIAPHTLANLLWIIPAGIAFGLAARLFAETGHGIKRIFNNLLSYPPLRPTIGGALIALIVYATGGYAYVGLGLPSIAEAFQTPVPWYDFLVKTGLTGLTLGSGFKGGEVTPLFFTGASLGNALSAWIPLPLALLAGCGFVGVFSGATNTPIASTILGMELFGFSAGIYLGIACGLAYVFSGNGSIYASQDLGWKKSLP